MANKALFIFLFSMVFGVSNAKADISRSCDASVAIMVLDNNPNAYRILGSIEGRASCKNLQPNVCRSQARAQINVCLQSVWDNRHADLIPSACKTLANGSSRPGARLDYDGIIPIEQDQRLTARAAFVACCVLRPNAKNLTVFFGGAIVGDEKCGSIKTGPNRYQSDYTFTNNYEMNCEGWREKGICGE